MKNWNLTAIFLLTLLLVACRTMVVSHTDLQYNRVADISIVPDTLLNHLIAPYRRDLDQTMNEVIGSLSVDLKKESPESNMGNWMADMLAEESRSETGRTIDFAILNQGGIRISSLSSGELTVGEIFELMPFDNLVVVLTGSGGEVKEFFDHISAAGGWPVSSEIFFEIEESKAVNILLDGRPLDMDKSYSFAVPDYLANGGSGSFFLMDLQRIETTLLVRDAFIRHIVADDEKGIEQAAAKEGRIKKKENE